MLMPAPSCVPPARGTLGRGDSARPALSRPGGKVGASPGHQGAGRAFPCPRHANTGTRWVSPPREPPDPVSHTPEVPCPGWAAQGCNEFAQPQLSIL